MVFLEKHYQVLFFPISFICEITIASSHHTIAVLYHTGESEISKTGTFPGKIKKSFEKLPSTLDIDEDVNIVYKDLNSTFCDLGTFLEFVDGISGCDVIVVLLLDDCQCEKKFMSYLDILKIKSVSNCERPLFIGNITSSIVKHVRKERQLYLVVPADAHGAEFYQDFTFELQRQKLKLDGALWVGGESVKEKRLQKELKSVAENIENNITSGATFVVGFLHPNDLRLKSLVNIVRKMFGKQFGKVLWLLPVMNWDLNNIQTFEGRSFHGLAFGRPGAVHCNHYNIQNCAMHVVLEKLSHVLRKCWNPHVHSTEERRNTRTAKCSVLNAEQRHIGYSVENKKCKTSQRICYVDILKLTSDNYIGDIIYELIGTWNNDTFQPCMSEDVFNDAILSPKIRTVFRIPVVEYFPYLVKHELNDSSRECPAYSLPCYGQRRKADNTTMINYADKYCCSGWTVEVLRYFTEKLSYEFELYCQAEELFGAYNNKTGEWDGMIQDVITGKGDLAVDLILRHDRCSALDCSVAYLQDGFNVLTKLQKNDVFNKDDLGNFEIFLAPFNYDLLIAVLVAFNVLLLVIWATDKMCLFYRNKRPGRKKEKFTILESMSYVWAIAFGRDAGDSKKPLTLSARYLASWLAFLSLIIVNVYVAKLMAEIVKDETTKLFTSLHDPRIWKNKLKLGLIKSAAIEAYFHNTPDPVLKQLFESNIKENILPSLDEAVNAVKNGTVDGYLGDTSVLTGVLNEDPNCSFSLMDEDFSENPVGLLFRKGWPWAEEFKFEALRINEFKRQEDLLKVKKRHHLCEGASQTNPQLSIADMSGVFLVIVFTVLFCCLSLIAENIYCFIVHRYREGNDRWNVPHA